MNPIDLDILHTALARYDLPAPLQIELRAEQGVNNLNLPVRTRAGTLRCKVFPGTHSEAAWRYEQQILQTLTQASARLRCLCPWQIGMARHFRLRCSAGWP